MEDPTAVWKFAAFFVKTYTPLLKDACEFVLPFKSSGLLTGSHAKEKCTYNKLDNELVQMGVFLLVDVED